MELAITVHNDLLVGYDTASFVPVQSSESLCVKTDSQIEI